MPEAIDLLLQTGRCSLYLPRNASLVPKSITQFAVLWESQATIFFFTIENEGIDNNIILIALDITGTLNESDSGFYQEFSPCVDLDGLVIKYVDVSTSHLRSGRRDRAIISSIKSLAVQFDNGKRIVMTSDPMGGYPDSFNVEFQ